MRVHRPMTPVDIPVTGNPVFDPAHIRAMKEWIAQPIAPLPIEPPPQKRTIQLDPRLKIVVEEYQKGNPLAKTILDHMGLVSDLEIEMIQDALLFVLGLDVPKQWKITPGVKAMFDAADAQAQAGDKAKAAGETVYGTHDECKPFEGAAKTSEVYRYDGQNNAVLPEHKGRKRHR